MRLLLDQGLAPAAAGILRAHNHDAVHVYDIRLHLASDAEILEYARASDRTCVTLDHDFHAHLARPEAGSPSVLFLRVQRLNASAQAE